MRISGVVFQYAADELKKDYAFVKRAIESNPEVFPFAAASLRDTEDIVLAAVAPEKDGEEGNEGNEGEVKDGNNNSNCPKKHNIHLLEYASDRLKGDRRFILGLVRRGVGAAVLEYVDGILIREMEISENKN
jgi:hypothetical protein